MPDSIDYEELSDKTIKEIKQDVEDRDVDLEKLLEAEKENKDRVTLKDWINDRLEEAEEAVDEAEDAAEDAEESAADESEDAADETDDHTEDVLDEPVDSREVHVEGDGGAAHSGPLKTPKLTFLGGLVVGILLATIVTWATMGGTGVAMSPDQAITETESYLDSNPNIQGNYTIGEVDARSYGDLYVVPVTVSSPVGTQTVQVYVSKQSGLLFLSTPIDLDTDRPVGVTGQSQTGNGTSQ